MIETTCLHWKDQYIEQGEKKGRQKERETIARKLAAIHMDEEQIMSLTDLSREDVRRVTAEALTM